MLFHQLETGRLSYYFFFAFSLSLVRTRQFVPEFFVSRPFIALRGLPVGSSSLLSCQKSSRFRSAFHPSFSTSLSVVCCLRWRPCGPCSRVSPGFHCGIFFLPLALVCESFRKSDVVFSRYQFSIEAKILTEISSCC